jgi:peptidoglycan/xylan/chitin deacetylase (PgdA/CDA1 family)
MSWDNIISLHKQGHDIESHTVNHSNLSLLDADSINQQLLQSKQDLLKHGINAPLFIYPFGAGVGDPDITNLVQQHYYAARSINHHSLNMSQPFDPYTLPGYAMGPTTTLEMFKKYVDQADGSTIVIIYYHNINNASLSTSVTPEDFAAQMQYLYDNNFTVQTLKQLFTSITPEG